jgi:putative PIN family toxin of toxin-antitoxin system
MNRLQAEGVPAGRERSDSGSRRRVRAVLDTNVLLDLWLFDDPSVLPLRTALESGRMQVLRSADIDAEFAEVIRRPQFGLDEATCVRTLAAWRRRAQAFVVEPGLAPLACTDPDDQKFLDLAFAAGADLLLTRDKALLKLARKAASAGLQIRRPAAMADDRQPAGSPNAGVRVSTAK